ncbi:MAG: hypothetical protein V4773_03920 [Verrucomicrobiota bacterium]
MSVLPPDTSRLSPWLVRCTKPWVAALVLALFYLTLLASLRSKSATFDEPGHITGGYVYWKYNDYRIDPENGNLSKRWMALPLLWRNDAFPAPRTSSWSGSSSWILSDAWFNRLNNDTTSMLASGRAMAGLVAVALGALVWYWSRHLFGAAGGMASLLLFVSNPAILANGGLTTSDTAATLGFLAAVGSVWAVLQRITVWRIVAGIFAIGGLFLAKMSAPLLIVMAGVLAVARIADGRPLPVGHSRLLVRRGSQTLALLGVALVQTVCIIALVWAAYGFRYSAFSEKIPGSRQFKTPWEWVLAYPTPAEVFSALDLSPSQKTEIITIAASWPAQTFAWSLVAIDDLEPVRARLTPAQNARFTALMRPAGSLVPRFIGFARDHHLLPEAFLAGYAHVWRTSDSLKAFMNGEIKEKGRVAFFPFVFAVKTPLSFLALLLIALGLGVVGLRRRCLASGGPWLAGLYRGIYPFLPFIVLLATYWIVALLSHLNIGHRHILPTYPPLFILCGGAIGCLVSRRVSSAIPGAVKRQRLAIAAASLCLLQVAETAYRFPNYIAYFNGLISPDQAYRHLVDSSLDWGQELPAIGSYLQRHPNEKSYLAYFGVGKPSHYGIASQYIGGEIALEEKVLAPPITTHKFGNRQELQGFLSAHPQFDPELVFDLSDGQSVALLQRSSAHRIGQGIYVISATMLQPLFHGKFQDFSAAKNEEYYRNLQQVLLPFFSDDRAAKVSAISAYPIDVWKSAFQDYYDYRLARLTAFLRSREPDDFINHSVLVYRLSDDDVRRALGAPLP